LDQLLGGMSVEQLQDMAAEWAPEAPASRSKLELFRILRDRMIEPGRVRRCLEACGPAERGVVRRLLRSEGAAGSVAALAVSSGARPRPVDEMRSVVAGLAARGLVAVEAERRWETYGSARASVPEELVRPLRGATGIDGRPWQEVLNLADCLAALPASEARRLTEPAACVERVERLPEPLREVVAAAIRRRGGIVPIDRLGELGVGLPTVDDALLARWRSELEAAQVGTVGDVSLLGYGIDLDGRVLCVFTEVAEALLALPVGGEVELTDPVGPDFLLDLSELVAAVRESGARLKASGALTHAAANRILGKLNRPSVPGMDGEELLELHVACAEKLGLLERGGESLGVRPSAWRWEGRSYEEKAADLFRLIGFALPTPRSKHHHERMCEAARERLRSLPPGEWRPSGALVHAALRRHLAGLDETDLRARIADAVRHVDEYLLPPFPDLGALAADLHESVVIEATAMGVLEPAEGAGGRAERLSDFGAVAAGREPAGLPPARLIVTPDFEVILLPEGDTTRLRYDVGQFAEKGKTEQTTHLRITKERVEEAVVRGLGADEMIRVLREASGTGTAPENVEASIRGWAERVRVATVEDVHVFELPDPRLLEVVAELPGLKDLIVRRISPTALALRACPADRRLLDDLRRLGVYVR